MQNRKALYSFLTVLFLLTFIWIFFLFTQSILKENSNRNLLLVPDEATFAMRLDVKEISEHTLFSVFLESKDKDLLKLMEESITKKINEDGRWKNYGIDYLSDIVLFEMPFDGENVQGILVNVSNEALFKKNMRKSGSVNACKDGVGIIFTSNKRNKSTSNSKLQSLAEKIIAKPQINSISAFIKNHGTGKFIETYHKGSILGKTSYFGQSNVLFELQKQNLLLSGTLQLNSENSHKVNTIKQRIVPQGLHFSSSIVPTEVHDSINKFLGKFSLSIPKINQISMNFMGTRVINHSSGFFVVPQIELYISCESEVSIQQIVSSSELLAYFDYNLNNGSISFQKEILYYEQISPTSFYIGINKNPVFETLKGRHLVKIEGSLKPLTHIEGGGLMTSFLEMMPIYRASKTLSSHTESIHIDLTQKGMKIVDLNGKLSFTEGFFPMNELVKFLLVGQLIQ